MSSSDQTTPRPWTVGTVSPGPKNHAVCAGAAVVANVLGNGYPVGKGWSPRSEADAELIVKAVNAYDALVDTLRQLVNDWKHGSLQPSYEDKRETLRDLQAAEDLLRALAVPLE